MFRARLAVGAVLAAVFVMLAACPAQAAAQRSWVHYELDAGQWRLRPVETGPVDGAVVGWRYAVREDASRRPPRATPSFADICATGTHVAPDKSVAPGKKRVGVVVDFGRDVDGELPDQPPDPFTACALVDAGATGAQVLSAVAATRVDQGQVCGVDGYPASGCGATLPGLSAAQRAGDEQVVIVPAGQQAGSGWDLSTSIALMVVLASVSGVVALLLRRRGRRTRSTTAAAGIERPR